MAEARRFVIPAWLHSSGVDGGNPVLCLLVCRDADGLLSLREAAKRRRSNLLFAEGIASLPAVARNDKIPKCSDFQIDARLDSGFPFAVPE